MPSPFPGMNPYLEQADAWEDFHHNFMTYAQAALQSAVGENYIVKVEVRLYLHELSAEERRYFGKADVGVSEGKTAEAKPTGTSLLAAPVRLILPAVDIERQAFLEIRDRRNRRVITVIELLSPTNKTGPDHIAYLDKRNQVLAKSTHLVEIDLRRGGDRPRSPELPQCDYYVLVSRHED